MSISKFAVILVGSILASGVLGCATQSNEPKSGHIDPNVRPGSHEDWCGEHAVPESQCTRCNPELTQGFKDKGDWCEEHGLPESQCLKCNPDIKIVRPPKDAT
ncbi:MAG TPA: hypothetical protein VHO25_24905 [Polyangiaceae bacterium]|nr:hypothetical protein [Polyangiaceae bacterium]